jgi:CBS domain-containing protein
MLAPLKSVLRRVPVTCPADATLADAVQRMHAERVGSIVVVDENGAAAGIFTTVDLLATAASGTPLDSRISRHMTVHPFTLEEESTLADAALAMARHGFRHVVATRDGKVAGVVSERDLFALQRVGMRRILERIQAASEVAQLAEAASDTRQLTSHLLAQGVDPGPLTSIVSALNDALTRRIIELAQERHRVAGAWCWLALGSEGRMEQTLVTDQDNALIIEEGKQDFLAFADQVNRDLDACGFPLCKGDVMARNPHWCLTLPEWERVFEGWIANNNPQALLNASIFFDFRSLAGEPRLAGQLRATVLQRASSDRAFCRALAEVALQTRPPLGLIADFSSPELDLKALGARIFVDAGRVLALSAASPETGTAARLQSVGEKTAVEAFHFLQTLRMRHGTNVLRPAELNEIDRTVLKAVFRQAALLQQRLKLDFAL